MRCKGLSFDAADLNNAYTSYKQFDEVRRVIIGQSVASDEGNALRIVQYVGSGLRGKVWTTSNLYRVQGCMYDTKTHAILSKIADRLNLGYYRTYNSIIDVDTVNAGWLVISMTIRITKDTNPSEPTISDSEMQKMLDSLHMDLYYSYSQYSHVVNTNYPQIRDVLDTNLKQYTSSVRVYNGYVTASGGLNKSVWYRSRSCVVKCKPGTRLYIKGGTVRNTVYAWLKSWTPPSYDTATSYKYDMCEGTTRVSVAANGTKVDYAPEDCTHIIFCPWSDLGTHEPSIFRLGNTDIDWTHTGFIVINDDMTNLKFDSIDSSISSLQDQINSIHVESGSYKDNEKKLYIGPLGNYTLNSSGYVTTVSNYQVSMLSAVTFPDYFLSYTIHCPAEYQIGFKYGTTTSGMYLTLDNDTGPLSYGDTWTHTNKNVEQCYRMYVIKNNSADTITTQEVETLINEGSLYVSYVSYDRNIIERNFVNESKIKAVYKKYRKNIVTPIPDMPTFTHTSDIHGDVTRLINFLDYSDFLNVDAAIVTGDIVCQAGVYDGTEYFDNVVDYHKSMTLLCMGNHDARGLNTKDLQSKVMNNIITKYNCEIPTSETNPTYFYKDISNKSIRIISVNMYEAGQSNTNNVRYTQLQMDFIVQALISTPENYGIVVLMHNLEAPMKPSQSKFTQDVSSGSNNPILYRIIDEFISRNNGTLTFTQPTSSGDETIQVSYDFTSIDSSVEFVCYMSGHRHRDGISYVDNVTNTQLMCNVTLGFGLYGNSSINWYGESSDLPRGGSGLTQDSFNLYSIDRSTKTLRIARIGSNLTSEFNYRDFEIIPYA